MHAWEAPSEHVTQAVTETDPNRPDPPEIDGTCEMRDCSQPAAVPVRSTDETVGDEWFLFCEDCAAVQVDRYDDLEVADR